MCVCVCVCACVCVCIVCEHRICSHTRMFSLAVGSSLLTRYSHMHLFVSLHLLTLCVCVYVCVCVCVRARVCKVYIYIYETPFTPAPLSRCTSLHYVYDNKYGRHQQVIRDQLSARELRGLQNRPE